MITPDNHVRAALCGMDASMTLADKALVPLTALKSLDPKRTFRVYESTDDQVRVRLRPLVSYQSRTDDAKAFLQIRGRGRKTNPP